jgi:GPH family glycoside/pentoside/hexuronide:cation symporter
VNSADRITRLNRQLEKMVSSVEGLKVHFDNRIEKYPEQAEHVRRLVDRLDTVRSKAAALQADSATYVTAPAALLEQADAILAETPLLKQQAPLTLFRLRLVEIGLPLALSIISIWLTLRYPLTEARCYEIKAALKKQRAESAT